MPFISSPVAYPPTSSPSEESPRKRRKIHEERAPLRAVNANGGLKERAGFLLENSDDEDEDLAALKARQVARAEKSTEQPFVQEARNSPQEIRNDLDKPVSTNNKAQLSPNSLPLETPAHPLQELQALQHEPLFVPKKLSVRTCSGKILNITSKPKSIQTSFERMVATRSAVVEGRAQKSYYGIEIHRLVDEASNNTASNGAIQENIYTTSIDREVLPVHTASAHSAKLMWTEKYRARKFTDLVGDERTHRSVLRWLKEWDPIVFPHSGRPKAAKRKKDDDQVSERTQRKVLLITGPPGLGKTTLAHVCAKQAGYEVQEINASDERSREIVKGRIRDMVCTENVRPVDVKQDGKLRTASRPVCVVVDEVDGVVGGSNGAGEGGFVKALVDLLALDQKNSKVTKITNGSAETRKRSKGDNFRMLRPLILICNDLYHPSLRLLRQGTMAEIVYIQKPPLNMVIPRLQNIFLKEGISCDSDGVRQLCEATWGVSNRKEDRSGCGSAEGDMRGILVVGEWAATKLRADQHSEVNPVRLTRRWVEQNILGDLAHGGGAARSLSRGGSREVVERVFAHNAGFPTTTHAAAPCSTAGGVGEAVKERAMQRLREMIESSGDDDRIMTDCFSNYATHPFQDDNFLSKPTLAYDWLHFHDTLSTLVHTSQEWELAPYLSTPVLAFHYLFASTSTHSYATHASTANTTNVEDLSAASNRPSNLTGPRAPYHTTECLKANHAALTQLQSQLSLPLLRAFRSPASLATDLLPYLLRLLNPDVKPVVVGGSDKGVASVRRAPEKARVGRAVSAMVACGVRFERGRVEQEGSGVAMGAGAPGAGWVYRMEPALDELGSFETAGKGGGGVGRGEKVRFAVRQVLEQEWRREVARRDVEARARRVTDAVRGAAGFGVDDAVQVGSAASRGGTLGTTTNGEAEKHVRGVKGVVKRDFFGRPVVLAAAAAVMDGDEDAPKAGQGGKRLPGRRQGQGGARDGEGRVWVTYHEGFSNAVRKGISLKELLEGL